jgi:hypothetical protein
MRMVKGVAGEEGKVGGIPGYRTRELRLGTDEGAMRWKTDACVAY